MNDRSPQPPYYPPYPGPYDPQNTQPGPWPPGPPAPPAPPPRRKGRVLASVLTVLILAGIGFALRATRTDTDRPTTTRPVVAAPTTGVKPVTLLAFDLKPGDCYTAAPLPADGSTTVVRSVQTVPCTQPHTAQVVAVPNYAGRSYDEAINTLSITDCTREFKAKLQPAVLKDKRYVPGRIYPDTIAWERSKTSVACIVGTDEPTTGSALKG